MNHMIRLSITLALLLMCAGAWAQTPQTPQTPYPDKAVRIVVPFPAGGGFDITARTVAQKFSEAWAKPVLIENVPGAAGSVGAERVAKSAPDGYTLLFSGDAAMTTNMTLYPKLGYDSIRDFAPIMIYAETPNILIVHPSLPVKNVKELVALAKQRPAQITYASIGAGTSQHLAGALLARSAVIDINHIPYKDGAQAFTDVIAGRVTMMFGNTLSTLPMVRAARVRAIAVSSRKRVAAAPELPTVEESGYPGFHAVAWLGLLAPVGTPAAVLGKIQQESARVIAMPDVRSKIIENGGEIVGNSPADFAAQIKAEIVSKGNLVKASGAKVN